MVVQVCHEAFPPCPLYRRQERFCLISNYTFMQLFSSKINQSNGKIPTQHSSAVWILSVGEMCWRVNLKLTPLRLSRRFQEKQPTSTKELAIFLATSVIAESVSTIKLDMQRTILYLQTPFCRGKRGKTQELMNMNLILSKMRFWNLSKFIGMSAAK